MKKTIFSILLTALIVYLLSMLIFFTPKTKAWGSMPNPIDLLAICCESSIEACCHISCTDQICPGGGAACQALNAIEIDRCRVDCVRDLRAFCRAFDSDD